MMNGNEESYLGMGMRKWYKYGGWSLGKGNGVGGNEEKIEDENGHAVLGICVGMAWGKCSESGYGNGKVFEGYGKGNLDGIEEWGDRNGGD